MSYLLYTFDDLNKSQKAGQSFKTEDIQIALWGNLVSPFDKQRYNSAIVI